MEQCGRNRVGPRGLRDESPVSEPSFLVNPGLLERTGKSIFYSPRGDSHGMENGMTEVWKNKGSWHFTHAS